MELLSKVIDAFIKAFGANPTEILFIFLFVGIFIWLSKELRNQLTVEKELHKERLDKSLTVLSEILIEGKNCENIANKEAIFRATFAAIPFIDYKLTKALISVMDSEEFSETKKSEVIVEKVKAETLSLSQFNKNLFKTNLLMEDAEKFLSKLWKVFEPIVLSSSIMFFGLILLATGLPWESDFWMFVKPASLILGGFLLIFAVDLITEKKLNKTGITLLIGNILSTFAIVASPEKYSIYFISFFAICFILFLYQGFKQNSKRNNK